MSEVLNLISSSQGALEPVFDAICKMPLASLTQSSAFCFSRRETHFGRSRCITRLRLSWSSDNASRCSVRRPTLHSAVRVPPSKRSRSPICWLIPDFRRTTGYSKPQIGRVVDARTVLAVPLVADRRLIGAVVIYRTQVQPFTDKQISWWRVSPHRHSSLLKTPDCSVSCTSVLTTLVRRWSSRLRPARY